MPKSGSDNTTNPDGPINISIYKPNGISSFWSWFSSKNKKVNLQNVMFDKKFKLKLSEDELNSLKLNGIDLKEIQKIAANNEQKKPMRRSIFILPKDKIDLTKTDLINNKVLCNIMKNNDELDSTKQYKSSLISSSTVSIKSNKNILKSNLTYIHSIKSKKSIVNNVSSKASLKVGLKNNNSINVPLNPVNRSILLKDIPALLKGNTQKKVFVPIYLGKKKSNKILQVEKSKKLENKSKPNPKDESNVIPLLLTKIKTMEGQLNDIENTTKKINEVVSQQNLFKKKSTLQSHNKEKTVQPTSKGLATHKIYSKRSSKRFKQIQQNGIVHKSKNNMYISKESSKNRPEFSSKSLTFPQNIASKNIGKERNKTFNDILYNPEILLRRHNLVIPSNLTEKTLFKANPNAGCDLVLKLFEALSEANDSSSPTDSSNNEDYQSNKREGSSNKYQKETQNKDIEINPTNQKVASDGKDKPGTMSSVSESHVEVIKKNSEGPINFTLKKNISCPSSTRIPNKKIFDFVSRNDLNQHVYQNTSHGSESSGKKLNSDTVDIKIEEQNNVRLDSVVTKDIPVRENNSHVGYGTKKESNFGGDNFKTAVENSEYEKEIDVGLQDLQHDQFSTEKIRVQSNGGIKDNDFPIVTLETEENKSIAFNKNIDDLSAKIEQNTFICQSKEFLSQAENTTGINEKHIVNLPIAIDSNKICSISIEQTEIPDLSKQLESEVTTKSCSNSKMRPKFNITILVKSDLNDQMQMLNNTFTNNRESIPALISKDENKESSKTLHEEVLTLGEDNIVKKESIENFPPLENISPSKYETSKKILDSTLLSKVSENVGCNTNGDKDTQPNIIENCRNKFGLEGVAYLNQEQRKVFDEHCFNKKENKVSTELAKPKFKSLAKSSIDLKCDQKPIRHMSESSLDAQKTAENILKNNPHFNKTLNKSIKNCRRTPFYLECLKYRKELDVTNKVEALCTYKNLNDQGPVCKDNYKLEKPLDNKEDFFVINNKRNNSDYFLSAVNYFDRFKRSNITFNAEREFNNKQDFFVVKNKDKITEDTERTGISNSSEIKKRTCRYSLTLNQEPILEESEEDPHYDKMSVGDHRKEPYENKGLDTKTSNKEINKYEQISETVKSQNTVAATPAQAYIKYEDANNRVVKTFQGTQLDKTNDTLIAMPVSEIPKCCPCILAKANSTTGKTVRSQAEIRLEKCGLFQKKIKNISIICDSCVTRSESDDAGDCNLVSSQIIASQETYSKKSSQSVTLPVENLTRKKHSEVTACSVHDNNETAVEVGSSDVQKNRLEVVNDENITSFSLADENEGLSYTEHELDLDTNKKRFCHHSCIDTLSEDNIFSDMSEYSDQNLFHANSRSDSSFLPKYNIGNSLVNYYTKSNENYRLDNLFETTTILDFDADQKMEFCRLIPEDTSQRNELTSYDKSIKEITINAKECDFSPPTSVISPPSNMIPNKGGTITKYKTNMLNDYSKQSKHIDECSAVPSRTACTDLFCNSQMLKFKKPKTEESVRNFDRNKYKTKQLKEHTLDNANDSTYFLPHELNFSSSYVVNYVHSIEYDIMSKNENSVLSCSLTEQKIKF